MQTKEITNFSGRLTRILNGDMDSGFAKFVQSWGYDPFNKPLNLTWLEKPADITGPITGLPLAGKTTSQSGIANAQAFIYDRTTKLYGIQSNSNTNPNVDSVLSIGSIRANLSDLSFMASMEFFGNTLQVYIGTETGVNRANFDGSADAFVGTITRYWANTYRPLKQFAGFLRFGNGKTIGTIDNTGTVSSPVASVAGNGNLYSDLNPPLPREILVQDLDNSIDGNYLLITGANQLQTERIDALGNDSNTAMATESALFKWNGSDTGVTTLTSLPSYFASSLQTYLGYNLFFANDNFGSSINDETQRILTLPNNKAPLFNATCTNGNFLTWWCPEVVSGTRYASLYYYGSLDQENPVGLYRVARWATTQSGGQVFQAPLNFLVGYKTQTLSTTGTPTVIGYGKHYLGVSSVTTGGTFQNFLLRFLTTPTGSGTPQLGVYETQTQLFSKKIGVAQIRVYTEPTVTGNGFQIDLIGSDGAVIDNGTFNYSFAAGSDITALQGSMERINFNPNMKTTYALGVRVTNTGTTNMTIKKIEIDYAEEGK
jgi:hypothetical protein